LREVTHLARAYSPGAVLQSRGARRAFRSPAAEASQFGAGQRRRGFDPSAPAPRGPITGSVGPRQTVSGRRSRRTPPCPMNPSTARCPVRQCRPRHTASEHWTCCGRPSAVHIDCALASYIHPQSLMHTPLGTGTQVTAFCLVPLEMTTQFSVPPPQPGNDGRLRRTRPAHLHGPSPKVGSRPPVGHFS
jgi:hypothetical protein